jgi:hypothetical protein
VPDFLVTKAFSWWDGMYSRIPRPSSGFCGALHEDVVHEMTGFRLVCSEKL